MQWGLVRYMLVYYQYTSIPVESYIVDVGWDFREGQNFVNPLHSHVASLILDPRGKFYWFTVTRHKKNPSRLLQSFFHIAGRDHIFVYFKWGYCLDSSYEYKLYCSPITRSLLLNDARYKHLKPHIVSIWRFMTSIACCSDVW